MMMPNYNLRRFRKRYIYSTLTFYLCHKSTLRFATKKFLMEISSHNDQPGNGTQDLMLISSVATKWTRHYLFNFLKKKLNWTFLHQKSHILSYQTSWVWCVHCQGSPEEYQHTRSSPAPARKDRSRRGNRSAVGSLRSAPSDGEDVIIFGNLLSRIFGHTLIWIYSLFNQLPNK